MPNSALPQHLRGKLHNDWPWPFCYIPRAWTSYKLMQPPKVILGYQVIDWTMYPPNGKKGPNPCQRHKWSWYLSWPLYFTITFPNKWYMRAGCRWDDNDFYFTIPSFDFKKVDNWNLD